MGLLIYEYYHNGNLLCSEYQKWHEPVKLSMIKDFYCSATDWHLEYDFDAQRELVLEMQMEKIVNGVVHYKSVRVIRDDYYFDHEF